MKILSRAAQIRSVDVENRRIDAVASTETVDSYKTIVRANWDLARFTANPVLLWAHDRFDLPVGHCENVRVEGTTLLFTAVFDAITARDEEVFRKYAAGTLKAFSVGFNPLEEKCNDGGIIEYLRSELLEISCVPVPANMDALVKSRSFGRSCGMKRSEHLKALKADSEEGDDEDKKKAIKAAYEALGGDDAVKKAEEDEGKDEGGDKKPAEEPDGDEEEKTKPSKSAKPNTRSASRGGEDLAVRVAELESQVQRREVKDLVDAHSDRFTPALRDWALSQSRSTVESYVKRAPKLDLGGGTREPPTRGLTQGKDAGGDPALRAKVREAMGFMPDPTAVGLVRQGDGSMLLSRMTPTQVRAALGKES